MITVIRKRNESIERLMKRFKRAVEDSGIMYELKDRKYFISPSEKIKMKKHRAVARNRREARNLLKKQQFAKANRE